MRIRKHIVLVSELGGNLGHIVPLMSVANALSAEGFAITFVLPSIIPARILSGGGFPYRLIQAPNFYFERVRANTEPQNYSEILLLSGYSQTQRLAIGLKAWRDLLTLLQPDLVIFDFAPTAQLAGRGLTHKTIILGNGYTVPPVSSSLPSFLVGANPARALESEHQLLININKALNLTDIKPIEAVSELFESHHTFVIGASDLDCYAAHRTVEEYVGVVLGTEGSAAPVWHRSDSKPRAFVYLHSKFPFCKELMALLSTRLQCNVYIGGNNALSPAEALSEFGHVSNIPYDMRKMAQESDVLISHGGFNTAMQFLVEGKPVILLPLYTEQKQFSTRVANLGLGLQVLPEQQWHLLRERLLVALQLWPQTKGKVSAFAQGYALNHGGANPLSRIVQRVNELLE